MRPPRNPRTLKIQQMLGKLQVLVNLPCKRVRRGEIISRTPSETMPVPL
jgi:hypothetical protein